MNDTGFTETSGRLPPCFAAGESGLVPFDAAGMASRWALPPAFPDARGGLVSTAGDLLRCAGALLAGGRGVLSDEAIEAMATDRLTAEQRDAPSAQAFLDGGGWGYGVQVVASDRYPRYGWGGGLGTLWYLWPRQRTAAVLLTQVLPPSPDLVADFMNGVERALGSN